MASESIALPPGLSILLVEDEPLIAMDGEAILLSLGAAHVAIARSVAYALHAIDGQTFHAAILDLRLGAETSVPLAVRLQELGVPFGFLTGYSGDAIPDPFKDRPVAAKPFAPDGLSKLLQALVAPNA